MQGEGLTVDAGEGLTDLAPSLAPAGLRLEPFRVDLERRSPVGGRRQREGGKEGEKERERGRRLRDHLG